MTEIAFVLLQAGGGKGPLGIVEMLLPFAVIFFIFYFLVMRPQQKQQREHQQMLGSIERGDAVVTRGGLHGRVFGVTDDVLTLEIAQAKGESIRVKVDRASVERRLEKAAGGQA